MNCIVNFKVKNFRSFYNETIFSMQATTNNEYNEFNTFLCDNKLLVGNENKLLKAALIFGANASGKSNLVKALNHMRLMVLNSVNANNPIVASIIQDTTTFAFYKDADKEPSIFEIEIIANDVFYNYGFEITNQKITREFLKKRTNGRLVNVFERGLNYINLSKSFKNNGIDKIDSQNLFISFANTPFLALDNDVRQDLQNVYNWFKEPNLFIVNDHIINRYKLYQEENGKYAKMALEFLKQADIGIEDFSVVQRKLADKPSPIFHAYGKHLPQVEESENEVLGLDLKTDFNVYNSQNEIVGKKEVYIEKDSGFHSDGTRRLMQILGLILKVLDKGGILVIDEMDGKLNFLIVDYIVKAFNSINKNINNAQLIATAHNVLLMDDGLRRDQIYFASKNKYGSTEIYSLADFNDVRKTDLFSKKYLLGFYSAIPNIKEDF